MSFFDPLFPLDCAVSLWARFLLLGVVPPLKSFSVWVCLVLFLCPLPSLIVLLVRVCQLFTFLLFLSGSFPFFISKKFFLLSLPGRHSSKRPPFPPLPPLASCPLFQCRLTLHCYVCSHLTCPSLVFNGGFAPCVFSRRAVVVGHFFCMSSFFLPPFHGYNTDRPDDPFVLSSGNLSTFFYPLAGFFPSPYSTLCVIWSVSLPLRCSDRFYQLFCYSAPPLSEFALVISHPND